MNKSTASEILTLLQKSHPLSVLEMSKLLNVSKADVRYHLKNLAKSGEIKKINPETDGHKKEPGRPASKYTVAHQNYPNNLEELFIAFLDSIPLNDKLIENTVERFTKINVSFNDANFSIFQRMQFIMIFFQNRNYQAKWEISPKGPLIIFQNCPYKQAALHHPQICEFDRVLIEKLTKKQAITQATIIKQAHECIFLLTS